MERLAVLPCAALLVVLTMLLPHLTAALLSLLALLLLCSLCLVAGLVLQVGLRSGRDGVPTAFSVD